MFEYYVTCPFCGHLNRIKVENINGQPICGNCENILPLTQVEETISPRNIEILKSTKPTSNSSTNQEEGCGCWLWAIFIFIILGVFSGNSDNLSQSKSTHSKRLNNLKQQNSINTSKDEKAALAKKEEELRKLAKEKESLNNVKQIVTSVKADKSWKKMKQAEREEFWSLVYQKCSELGVSSTSFWNEFSEEISKDAKHPPRISGNKELLKKGSCPFSITTLDTSQYYFVKLIPIGTTKEINFFFKGGYFETKVAPGSYKFKYCYGQKWYGWVLLFGPEKNYFQSDDILLFRTERQFDGIKFLGNRIELRKQINGNFHTKPIDENKF